jgi:hypothetical protein
MIRHLYKNRKDIFSHQKNLLPVHGPNDFLIPIFSVPLLHIEIKNWDKKKQELLQIYSYSQKNAIQIGGQGDVNTDYHYNSKNGNTYSPAIYDILEEDLLLAKSILFNKDDFQKNKINGSEYLYSPEELDDIEFVMENSWFETSTKLTHHEVHTHGPVGYSIVVFIEYDETVHSPTQFVNPFVSSFIGNPQNYSPSQFVKEGSMIIFPAPILHYTSPNESDVKRVVLAFNTCTKSKTTNEYIFV